MIISDYFELKPCAQWHLARQAGVEGAVIRLPETEDFSLSDISQWKTLLAPLIETGFKPVAVEPLPNRLHKHIKEGDGLRDQSIDEFLKMLPILESMDIRVVCANFMARVGWYRTRDDIAERGGALVTGFDIAEYRPSDDYSITPEALWENLAYFLKAVVPEAEKRSVKIALHPDDPPVDRLGNVSRILTSRANIDRALSLIPSPSLGVTLCQGCYGAMGEDVVDTIRHFGDMRKIFFVHFRDVTGCKTRFRETFHDDGPTDMAEALSAYMDAGFAGPIRVDHVPTMFGEDNKKPGYQTAGRLFALGYLRGLLDALRYDASRREV